MYRYVVITDPQTAGGFALGGVEVVSVNGEEGPGTVRDAVRECLEDPHVGLVGLNDRYMPQLGPNLTRRIERSVLPVVVVFPDPRRVSATEVESYLSSLIRRAIGYRIRLRT